MTFPYRRFRLIVKELDKLCIKYNQEGIFLLRPKFGIVDFALRVNVKFRILTFNVEKIFDYQPKFAADVYKIIYKNRCV